MELLKLKEDNLSLDPSCEFENVKIRGLQHKYPNTALILATNKCFEYCDYCFRKRNFYTDREMCKNINEAIEYVKSHPLIDNVLISGGDPLTLSNEELDSIFSKIPKNIKIRVGTKALHYNPSRLDVKLSRQLKEYDVDLTTHFVHPDEISPYTKSTLEKPNSSTGGLVLRNQAVLLRGINDTTDTLVKLFNKLVDNGIFPYYLFQCRPTKGNLKYAVPLSEGIDIVEEARANLSGMAKSFRYVMSHKDGKIEIVGKYGFNSTVFKFHQAKQAMDRGKIFIKKLEPGQTWLQ
ncbi:MAG: 4Fe-4S cluster-binding domain-containing protein [Deltaproteobacteria bacterium]|nr:4Fe-4S cluster-binding domain-containing protein [Deltaproteobacteria bacterium]